MRIRKLALSQYHAQRRCIAVVACAQPVRFSHFYGQADMAGAPVLAPGRSVDAAGGPAEGRAGGGCAEACVGDVVTVEVDVVSRLPGALPTAGACLRLALLQARLPLQPCRACKYTAAPSSCCVLRCRAGGAQLLAVAGRGLPPMVSCAAVQCCTTRSALRSRLTCTVAGERHAAGTSQQADRARQELSVALAPRESGELGAALAAGESARFGTRWAETEEVACPLAARPSPHVGAGVRLPLPRNLPWCSRRC